MLVPPARPPRTSAAVAIAFVACLCKEAGAEAQATSAANSVVAAPAPVTASPSTRQQLGPDVRRGPFGGRRFGMGGVVGYGATLEAPGRIEIEPLAWFVGLRFDYDFASGIRLGAYLDYMLGNAVTQTYAPVAAAELQVRAQTGLTNGGLSLGFDERLGRVVLRYALDIGCSYLRWKFAGAPEAGLGRYTSSSGGNLGFHFAPGLGLLWPIEAAFVGLEYRYLIQFDDLIPSGVIGMVHGGVRW